MAELIKLTSTCIVFWLPISGAALIIKYDGYSHSVSLIIFWLDIEGKTVGQNSAQDVFRYVQIECKIYPISISYLYNSIHALDATSTNT